MLRRDRVSVYGLNHVLSVFVCMRVYMCVCVPDKKKKIKREKESLEAIARQLEAMRPL